MYEPSIDTCKLELLKTKPDTKHKPAPRAGSPPKQQKQETTIEPPVLEVGKYIDIEAPIVDNPTMAKGVRQDGTEWIRTNFTVNHDGQELRVTLWDELAKKGMEYKSGQYIKFKGIRVDEYKGSPQLSSAKFTEILS